MTIQNAPWSSADAWGMPSWERAPTIIGLENEMRGERSVKKKKKRKKSGTGMGDMGEMERGGRFQLDLDFGGM